MVASIDDLLTKQLRTGADPLASAREYATDPQKFLPHPEMRRSFAHWLFQIGQWNSLRFLILKDLEQEKPALVPFWVPFLKQAQIEISESLWSDLCAGAQAGGAIEDLARGPITAEIDPRLQPLQHQLWQALRKEQAEIRQQLIDQAKRFSNDRLFDQESEALERLAKLYPEDNEILERRASFATRKAREVVSSSRRSKWHDARDALRDQETLPPELEKSFKGQEHVIIDAAVADPVQAYDLAIGLAMMGRPHAALEALELAPETTPVLWFRLELLLQTHRYLEAISGAADLGKRLGPDPESVFAAHYVKAQALWGLRKKSDAIESLKELVAVRPNYRSAHALLLSWQAEGP